MPKRGASRVRWRRDGAPGGEGRTETMAAAWAFGSQSSVRGTPLSRERLWRCRSDDTALRGNGHADGECCSGVAGTLAAADVDGPAIFFDRLGGHPQAESCAGFALGGDEGLEDLRQQIGRDSRAAVGDGETHAIGAMAGLRFGDPYAQLAAAPHRVNRVPDDVGDHLAELAGT